MRDLAAPSGYMPVANLGNELGLRVRPTVCGQSCHAECRRAALKKSVSTQHTGSELSMWRLTAAC